MEMKHERQNQPHIIHNILLKQKKKEIYRKIIQKIGQNLPGGEREKQVRRNEEDGENIWIFLSRRNFPGRKKMPVGAGGEKFFLE